MRAIKNIEEYDLMETAVPLVVEVYLWGAWEPLWGGGTWADNWKMTGGLSVGGWDGEEEFSISVQQNGGREV